VKIFRRGDLTSDGFPAGNQDPNKRGLFLAILGLGRTSGGDENERNKGDDWTRSRRRRPKNT
jgi:hypothetical protein